MKKLSALAVVSFLASNVFAEVLSLDFQCPPVTALHHQYGKTWTVDEKYQSQGWYVVQTPDTNWNYYSALPKKSNLVAYLSSEEEKSFGYFPYFISCTYQYGSNNYENIILKSVYPMEEGTAVGFSHDGTRNNVYDCQTTGDKPEVCTWKMRSIAVDPNGLRPAIKKQ